jgi:hypothetical protein
MVLISAKGFCSAIIIYPTSIVGNKWTVDSRQEAEDGQQQTREMYNGLFPCCTCPNEVHAVHHLRPTICSQRIWTEFLNRTNKLGSHFGKTTSHRGRQVDHPGTLTLEPDLFQQAAQIFYSLLGAQITFQVMTVSGQSTRDHHTVGAIFKGSKGIEYVEFAGAGQFDYLHRRRVLEAQAPGQVGGGVSTMPAAKGDDVGFPS